MYCNVKLYDTESSVSSCIFKMRKHLACVEALFLFPDVTFHLTTPDLVKSEYGHSLRNTHQFPFGLYALEGGGVKKEVFVCS